MNADVQLLTQRQKLSLHKAGAHAGQALQREARHIGVRLQDGV